MSNSTNRGLSIIEPGVLAASLLENACNAALASGHSLQLEVVRDLAEDLKHSLLETPRPGDPDAPPELLIEASLRCADLANLAACNASQLPVEHRPLAVAAVHLSSASVKALNVLAGAASSDTPNSDNLLRDARSAGWRADLALRQLEKLTDQL